MATITITPWKNLNFSGHLGQYTPDRTPRLAIRRRPQPPSLDPLDLARREAARQKTSRELARMNRGPLSEGERRRLIAQSRQRRLQAHQREREQARQDREALVEAERRRAAQEALDRAAREALDRAAAEPNVLPPPGVTLPPEIGIEPPVIQQSVRPTKILLPRPGDTDIEARMALARERLGLRGIYR